MPLPWRTARSLLTLREQINDRYPTRNRASDGTIGDTDHQNRSSDHNPWYQGHIVTALDITHDPGAGVDIDRLTDELAASRDPRIKYVIANDLILSGNGGPSPWVWREYHGINLHTSHFHLSVVASPACDDTSPWNLPSLRLGGGSTPPAQEDDMDATQARQLDELHRLWRKGNHTPGHNQTAGELTLYFVEMLKRGRRQEGVIAGLLQAVKDLAGGRGIDPAVIEAAAEKGAESGAYRAIGDAAEGNAAIDITITPPEGSTAT